MTVTEGSMAAQVQEETQPSAARSRGAASVGSRPGVPQVRFNVPTGTRRQKNVITRHIRRLIRGAPRGSEISVSLFHFISWPMAVEFVRAKRRGVHVRIVLNSDNRRYKAFRILRSGLGQSTRRRSWVTVCPGRRGCIAPRWRKGGRDAINHNKYYLFSATSGLRNVVVQASGNLTWWAETVQWNNALTVADPRIYAGYRGYFTDQARRRTTADYRRYVTSGATTAQFFPRSHDDPVLAALNAVSCEGGTRIRIAVGFLTWRPVARRLRDLARGGCQVRIVATGFHGPAVRLLTSASVRGRMRLRQTPERSGRAMQHSKYMLIDGTYLGHRRRIVLTGSNNYTTAGFRKNDETLLATTDDRLHARYLRNFQKIWPVARPFPRRRGR